MQKRLIEQGADPAFLDNIGIIEPQLRDMVDTDKIATEEVLVASRWSTCRHVYRIDGTLLQFLRYGGESIPASALKSLPFPILFVQFPNDMSLSQMHTFEVEDGWESHDRTSGFFAVNNGDEFFIGFVSSSGKEIMAGFFLDPGGGISAMIDEAVELEAWKYNIVESGIVDPSIMHRDIQASFNPNRFRAHLRNLLEIAFGCLLYIISQETDVETVYMCSGRTKRGKREQTESTIHDVGARVGRRLGEATRRYGTESSERTGRTVAPHWRRAHFHSYHTGPKENPTGVVVHWLEPMFVNAGAAGGESCTIVHET